MPFQSKAQAKKFRVLAQQGKIDPKVVEEWSAKTDYSKLPDKKANQVAIQSFLPLLKRRDQLNPEEQAAIQSGQSQWFPKLFPSDATPLPQMMASPLKNGLLSALIPAVAGGSLGHLAGSQFGPMAGLTGASIGALGLGGVSGLIAALQRRAENENLEEAMRRLPPNATLRDRKSDPVYQREQGIGDGGTSWQDTARLLSALRPRVDRSAPTA